MAFCDWRDMLAVMPRRFFRASMVRLGLEAAASASLGVEVGGDGGDGEFGFSGVFRDEGGDGGHGSAVANEAGLRGVVGGLREVAEEVGVDLTGEGVWDVWYRV